MGDMDEFELMAFPLISLVPKLLKAASSILGIDSVKDVVDVLQNNKLTPEQRVALETALLEHERELKQLDVAALAEMVKESVASLQSDDKYVARARPTGLYIAYLLTAALCIGLLAGLKLDTGAMATLLVPLWGSAGYYQYLRSGDKRNGNGKE